MGLGRGRMDVTILVVFAEVEKGKQVALKRKFNTCHDYFNL